MALPVHISMNPLDIPNPFVLPFGGDNPPPLETLAVIARLHLSTLTWEQAEAAMKPLLAPLPRRHRREMQRGLKIVLTQDLPQLLRFTTQETFMLHHDVPTYNIAEQDNQHYLKYLAWKNFRQGTFQPPPPPQAVPLYLLEEFKSKNETGRGIIIEKRNSEVRRRLTGIARSAAGPDHPAVRELPALADQISLTVTCHPVPPPSPEMTAGELYRYRELEWTLQERHRQRLREQRSSKERKG